ncbi:MAG TPA: hypothetical protein DEP84_24735, partial [Chloroflexi bacterium]|nr:hypothetical protein [Chloroflexota bacterium]
MLSQPRTVLASRPRSRLGRRIGFSAGFRLFVGAFFGYALFAAGAVWGYHLELEEALERTADAAYLLFSRAPHYGAIATHWPPLAAILQVPLVLLLQIGGGSLQFGGNLLAALAAAGTLVVLERLFGVCDLSRRWRAALLLLYGLNPMVLFYAINGTSESLLLFWLCLAFYGLVCWWRGRPASASGLSGLAMSAAFLTRYESVVLAGAMALAFASGPPRRRRHRWMGLALFGTPVLYTVSFWLAFNLITMRSPFFFVRDASTDLTTLSLMVSPEQRALTAQLSASLAATLSFSGVRLLLIFPLGLPLIALAAWSGWRGGRAHARRLLQMLTGLAITSLAVQTLMLFLGLRLPGLRPFLLLIPISFILFAVLVSQWKQEGSSKGERCAAEPTGSRLLPSHPIWLLLFLASNAVTLAVMAHPAPATDEAPFVAALRSGEP